jgi:hypothetical protein
LGKLDQVLNITPDDIDTVALKAAILQAGGEPLVYSNGFNSPSMVGINSVTVG